MSKLSWLGIIALATLSCSEAPVRPTSTPEVKLDSGVVIPTILRSLDENGQFPTAEAIDGEIDARTANELARIWIRDYAKFTLTSFAIERGQSISLAGLGICGRAYHAKSPYAPQQDVAVRKYFGSYWLVQICSADVPVISLAVSALNTDLEIREDTIRWPSVHGSDWYPVALPLGTKEFPLSPEAAVGIVADSSGRRADQIPELVLAGPPYMPQVARWRIHVEGNADIEELASGSRRSVPEIFVARTLRTQRLQILAATDSQPDHREVKSFGGGNPNRQEDRVYRLTRRNEFPVSFVPAGIRRAHP